MSYFASERLSLMSEKLKTRDSLPYNSRPELLGKAGVGYKPSSFIGHIRRRIRTMEADDFLYFKAALRSTHRRVITTIANSLPGSSRKLDYNQYLSEHEKTEILNYPTVYYIRSNEINDVKSFTDNAGLYIVNPKDHLAYRFEIIEVVGQGAFGQVLRCLDHKSKQEVAIKILKKFEEFYESGKNELKILEKLNKNSCKAIVRNLESFEFRGHLCIVFELLSINLYQLLHKNNFRGFSISLVRRFTQQILNSLAHIHSHNIIHCDLKPDNILLKQEKKSLIKVIDFGSSCEESKRMQNYIQSRFYRAPEIVLDASYNKSIDIWSLGCIVVEFITGQTLFEADSEFDLFKKFIQALGKPPAKLLESGKRSKIYYDCRGKFRGKVVEFSNSIQDLLSGVEPVVIDFVVKCLAWNPHDRISAEEGLSHDWFRTGTRSRRSSVDLEYDSNYN